MYTDGLSGQSGKFSMPLVTVKPLETGTISYMGIMLVAPEGI